MIVTFTVPTYEPAAVVMTGVTALIVKIEAEEVSLSSCPAFVA